MGPSRAYGAFSTFHVVVLGCATKLDRQPRRPCRELKHCSGPFVSPVCAPSDSAHTGKLSRDCYDVLRDCGRGWCCGPQHDVNRHADLASKRQEERRMDPVVGWMLVLYAW